MLIKEVKKSIQIEMGKVELNNEDYEIAKRNKIRMQNVMNSAKYIGLTDSPGR